MDCPKPRPKDDREAAGLPSSFLIGRIEDVQQFRVCREHGGVEVLGNALPMRFERGNGGLDEGSLSRGSTSAETRGWGKDQLRSSSVTGTRVPSSSAWLEKKPSVWTRVTWPAGSSNAWSSKLKPRRPSRTATAAACPAWVWRGKPSPAWYSNSRAGGISCHEKGPPAQGFGGSLW